MQMLDPIQPNVSVSPPEVLEIVKCDCSTDTLCSTVICGCDTSHQGLKKCKFPGKLVEISRGPQVEDDRLFMTSQKQFVFLKTLHSRAVTITAYT